MNRSKISYHKIYLTEIILLFFMPCVSGQPDVKLHIEGSAQFDKIGAPLGRLILNTVSPEDPGRYGIQFSNNTVAPFLGDDIGDQNYNFYSKWSNNRTYDAIVQIHGKASNSWGRYLRLTHNGTDGIIATDDGDLILSPSFGTGNVGIGTQDPLYPLHVATTGFSGFLLTGNNSGDLQVRIQNLGGGNHFIFDDISESNALGIESSSIMLFNTDGANERMRILANGHMGINTPNPQVQLDVRGNHLRLTSLAEDKHIQFRTDGTALDLDATSPLYIQASGFVAMGLGATNVGIGTDNPTDKLQVGESGDGSVARANDWALFSDRRWKKDLVEIDDPLSKLKALSGYYYYWKKGQDKTRQVGFVAQEVEAVLPEVVSTDANGYKSMDYGKMSAVLVEALKIQQLEIEKLKIQLSVAMEIKKENENLKARIDQIEKHLFARTNTTNSK